MTPEHLALKNFRENLGTSGTIFPTFILNLQEGAHCQLLRADLDGKVALLDLPFQTLLDSVILFYSGTHSKIEKKKKNKASYSLGVFADFLSF